MKIIITAPSLDESDNISGISSVTQFIINNNTSKEYVHFELGKKDNEKRNVFWFGRILKSYLKWTYLMVSKDDILIHFNLALSMRSIVRDSPLISIARIFSKRMIIHLHGGEFLMHRTMPFWIKYLLSFSLSGKIPKIVLSPLEKETLKQEVNCDNIFVLQNCIELKAALEHYRPPENNGILILLFMGRISVNKGLGVIFEALECLKPKNIKFRFVMAGRGPDESLYVKKFTKLLGDDFEYKGVVSGERKAELLRISDVFLLPSYFEGLPMALLESMSFGVVPVTTNVGSIKYVVTDKVNGIIVNKHSAEEVASAIEKLANDREYMSELSRNARSHILGNYNPAEYITRLNEIYSYE